MQDPGVLLVADVTPFSRLALASMRGVHTKLAVLPLLKVEELILTLDQFLNFKRRRDRKVSVHTTHTSKSQSRGGSYISHEENTRNMQLEINCLRKRLCRK